MNEQAIVQQSLSDINSALPAEVSVRTSGGDGAAGPPLAILDWDSTRLSENGANPLGDIVRDDAGDAVGFELHRYHQMNLDVTIRAYEEGDRDRWLSDVGDYFLEYEYDADAFDSDTTEWEVGDVEPRNNPVVEPDWYESGLVIRFKYVSRTQKSADALSAVQENVDGEMN